MGLNGAYNDPVPEDIGIATIKYAFSKGITFFDTADVYGANANEILAGKVGRAIHFYLLFTVLVGKLEKDFFAHFLLSSDSVCICL